MFTVYIMLSVCSWCSWGGWLFYKDHHHIVSVSHCGFLVMVKVQTGLHLSVHRKLNVVQALRVHRQSPSFFFLSSSILLLSFKKNNAGATPSELRHQEELGVEPLPRRNPRRTKNTTEARGTGDASGSPEKEEEEEEDVAREMDYRASCLHVQGPRSATENGWMEVCAWSLPSLL